MEPTRSTTILASVRSNDWSPSATSTVQFKPRAGQFTVAARRGHVGSQFKMSADVWSTADLFPRRSRSQSQRD